MAASVDDLMSAAQMRPILAVAKREPVSVSLGLTADKSAAVLVSKKLAPKRVRTQMRSEAKKLKLEIESSTIRFGVAEVDDEGSVLLFRVNKAPSGALVTKVRERMRKANWSKIEFVVDESLEGTPEDEGETAEGAAAAPSAGPDAEALRQELAELIGRIPAAVAAGGPMDALRPLAAAANEAMKDGTDLPHAAIRVGSLRTALDAAGAGGSATGSNMDPEALLRTFREAKDEVDDGLNKLGAALRATGDLDMLQIADYGLYGMADGGGVGLMKALLDLRGSRPETREAAAKAARDAAGAYKAAVLRDSVVDLVDANPFGVEVGIKSKLVAALDIIARAA